MRGSSIEALPAEKKFANADYPGSMRAFFRERLEFYLKEACGQAYDVVNAVLAADADDVVDAVARARGGEQGARIGGL